MSGLYGFQYGGRFSLIEIILGGSKAFSLLGTSSAHVAWLRMMGEEMHENDCPGKSKRGMR